MTSSPTCFSTGIDSPVIIDSSTALAPVDHLPIDRDLLARADDHSVADQHLFHGKIDLLAVAQDARRLGLKSDQLLDGLRGPSPCLDLQRKTEDDERDDDIGDVPEHLGKLRSGKTSGQATATTE